MKAVVLTDPHTMTIEDVPRPAAGEGEVLIKVDWCGICGTDVEFYETGSYNPDWILGHECSGTIEEIGPGVDGWNLGERVTINDLFSCGECDYCNRGLESVCANTANLGIHWPGAFAEYTKAPARSLFRLPESVSMKEGALVPTLAVGHHVFKRADARPGMKTLVIGAGPVGLGAIAALNAAGVKDIVASDISPVSRAAALSLGAIEAIDPGGENLSTRLETIFSGPPELVIECVGAPGTILDSLDLVDRGGTVAIVGNCFEEITLNPIVWIMKEINIKASLGTDCRDFDEAIGWIAGRKIDSSIFMTRTITLDDLPQTMEELTQQKNDIKIMVKI
jgi:threonine dehydrogenase-like Zn-dependent dehydrogenase